MTLDDVDKQALLDAFRDKVVAFRTSSAAVAKTANFGAPGGDAERKHRDYQAAHQKDTDALKHLLADAADEGVSDDELGRAATLTPNQLADLRRELG
jgi:hypothetical protein